MLYFTSDIYVCVISFFKTICNANCILALTILSLLVLHAGIDTGNPNAVVIGLAPDKFDYASINNAFR